MTEYQPLNGYVVVKPIYTEPTTSTPLINPNTQLPYASKGNFKDHPYRGLVMYVSPYYMNGGIKYDMDIKKGDIVYLPGEILERGTEYVIMDGIDYPCIRYALILGKCTPTAEETQSLKFKVEEKAKAIKGEKPLSLKN